MTKKDIAKGVTRLRLLKAQLKHLEVLFQEGRSVLATATCPLKIGQTVEWPDRGNQNDIRRGVVIAVEPGMLGSKGEKPELWKVTVRKYKKACPKELMSRWGHDFNAHFYPNHGSFAAGLVKVVKPLEGAEMP